ncbi:hypothetical protein [Kitasatospora griseola]|uniref:hypothetical protein n=1 Tax=Kitasatospora griseola TaxID=2064 RepID=UPI0037FA872C
MDEAPANRLELHVGDRRHDGRTELRFLVDGRDLLATGFLEGSLGPEPACLLGPYSHLLPDPEPREVRLHRAACGDECCGALYVTLRREGGVVLWDGWRNPRLKDLDLPPYRFDAEQYLAEFDRAGAGFQGGPARSVGRLLERELVRRPGVLAAWECEFHRVWWGSTEPDRVEVSFWHPAAPDSRGDLPWLQLIVEMTFPDGDPVDLAAGLVDRLASADPRTWARVCGGSPDHAQRLGHPWPEDM